MPLAQLSAGSAFQIPPNFDPGEDRYCLSKAYWRFDWEKASDGQQFYPLIVVHLHQKVAFKLPFLGGILMKTNPKPTPKKTPKKTTASFLCVVDLPDNVLRGGNTSNTSNRTPFAKIFGQGKSNLDKQQSLGLGKLRRSMVCDSLGDIVPGFPLVMVELPFEQSPLPKNSSGLEVHDGWHPPDNVFHEQPQSYLKMFQMQSQKLGTTLENLKEKAKQAHEEALPPWGIQVSFS